MKSWKKILTVPFLAATLLLLQAVPAMAAVTEADVQAVGKETVAGNVLIWFLCAVAFLKISQKIDSFMSSLGVNVGHTGGSMMAELMIAAKGLTTAKNVASGGMFRGGSFRGGPSSQHMNSASFMSGEAVQSATGQGGNPISRKMFESSLQKGGSFANDVTGAVAKGNINYTGTMSGPQAAQALTSYLGQTGVPDAPAYKDVEIGGGRISGIETSVEHPNGTSFGMYQTDQYMAPEGNYDVITAADNSTWYRQYAKDTVERTPYMTEKGQIAYHEKIVKQLPNMPKRKDRI